jgi:hypothetical protein
MAESSRLILDLQLAVNDADLSARPLRNVGFVGNSNDGQSAPVQLSEQV